jgi:hypothetical protein
LAAPSSVGRPVPRGVVRRGRLGLCGDQFGGLCHEIVLAP